MLHHLPFRSRIRISRQEEQTQCPLQTVLEEPSLVSREAAKLSVAAA